MSDPRAPTPEQAFVQFTRASTNVPVYIDEDKVPMIIGLRAEITRIYLSAEDHYVDVVGALEWVVQTLTYAKPVAAGPVPTPLPAAEEPNA